MILVIEIPGAPEGKERPRKGKGGHFYTPSATRAYEKRVHALAWEALQRAKLQRLRGAVGLEIVARFPLPATSDNPTWESLVATLSGEHYVGTPDGDNVLKLVKDGLNREVYEDDRQVADERIRRRYVLAGEEPGITITAWPLTREWPE